MPGKFYSKFWVIVTVIIFGGLFLILLPMMYGEYGLIGVVMLSPLLVVAAVLAYTRGYWVSRWMSEYRDRRDRRDRS